MSHVWRTQSGTFLVAAKGAPEAILDLCHTRPDMRGALIRSANEMATEGFRVLGACPSSRWSSCGESDSLLVDEQGISPLED
jgi:P-type Ca2+ transporter type 2C